MTAEHPGEQDERYAAEPEDWDEEERPDDTPAEDVPVHDPTPEDESEEVED